MRNSQQDMIDDINAEVCFTHSLIGKNALDSRVMKAMHKVPRDAFVPPDMRSAAFENGPLPIGYGQTISQPYIVALMTDLLAPEPEHRILEIGTGSGYQAAILSQLCSKVYTVEVVDKLSKIAAGTFKRLGYHNIEMRTGDGHLGWPEHALYDGIIVTAAAAYIPAALVEQLKPGGRLIIPVGLPYCHQELLLVKKDTQGKIQTETVLGVAFVPLVEGRHNDHHQGSPNENGSTNNAGL